MRTPPNESVTADSAKASEPKKRANERTCILTGEAGARDALIRLAVSPEGLVLPDPHAKAPGRGAWIAVDRRSLEKVLAKGKLKGALARAFKGAPLSIPDDLPERIEAGLIRSLTARLGLELRAGHAVLGSAKIEAGARSGTIELLLHASDASEDGRKKLDQAWRVGREMEGTGARGTVLPLDREALSVALGRENTVHLALADCGAAARVRMALGRLLHFSGADEAKELFAAGDAQAPQLDDEVNF
jgi:predicted RNA-binding protein YlxR (DUF448 family)